MTRVGLGAPPDLLANTPMARFDRERLREALTFGFAHGVSESTWADLHAQAALPPSHWTPSSYAKDLFVADFVRAIADLGATRGGGGGLAGARLRLDARWLERILTHPPEDRADVEHRRRVLEELAASPSLRIDAERIYAGVRRLRTQLEVSPARATDVIRRRLEILESIRVVAEAMSTSLEGARSPLTRVSAFAKEACASAGFAALVDLLEYDAHLATIDVSVRVGADGRVRGLALLDTRENSASRFARSPIGRFFSRVTRWFRGYRFDADEVVARAVEEVYDGVEELLVSIVQIGADLELYLAALSFRDLAERAGLAVSLPELVDRADAPRVLTELFNPHLLRRERRVVPCSLTFDRADSITIVTGPNSGGKTRLLQSVGLAQLLGQCGFYVPAARATLVVTDGMFASFAQAGEADAAEGRLGTELLRVRALFETLGVGGLVLIDELCSGTNPTEGQGLFALVLELLSELAPQALLSTHFLDFAASLEKSPPVAALRFLQVELDDASAPTYRFVPGVATTSLAHEIAARLGVTRQDLTTLVRRAVAAKRT